MEAVQHSMAQLQQLFMQRMDAYEGELQVATPSTNVNNLASDFTAFRSFIMTAIQCLQDQVAMLVQQQDSMEMRSRRKILLLHGVVESKDEDTASVVARAVATHTKLSVTVEDISRCHRMGRASTPDKPRPILFKLRTLEIRNKIWFAKTGLKGSGLTLSEFLTKTRHQTFMVARQRYGIGKCWTKDGFVFISGADGIRHRISSLAELDKIGGTEAPIPVHDAPKESIATAKPRRAASKKR